MSSVQYGATAAGFVLKTKAREIAADLLAIADRLDLLPGGWGSVHAPDAPGYIECNSHYKGHTAPGGTEK